MPSVTLHTVVCPVCQAELPAAADRCQHCGAATAASGSPRGAEHAVLSQQRLLDNAWLVLILLFCVAAVFGLPFLWYSRAFSTLTKIVLSIVVVLYTALLLWLTWLILSWCWGSISRSLWELG